MLDRFHECCELLYKYLLTLIQWLLQVRKLEFILAQAIEKSYKHILTAGSIVSNHCRTTSVACVELGLQPHLFLRTDAKVSV